MPNLKQQFPSYQSTLSELSRIQKPGIRLDLEPIRGLVARLGNPWEAFPCILVAGTNGKGSTSAVLSEILGTSGYKVGLYTSPHLSSYRERIVIRGSWVDEHRWCSSFAELHQAISDEKIPFTQFEILTALAFLIFKEEKVDLAVLEIGLGGRLDAVNVVEPLLSLITRIDHDHHEYLGESLSLIAGEKAGILRKNRTALTIRQQDDAFIRLEEEATRLGSKLRVVHPGILQMMSLERQTFEYQGETFEQSLIGSHQIENACLALEAAHELANLGFKKINQGIHDGIKSARWPARFEVVSRSPEIVVDGAHNPGGCEALIKTLNMLPLHKPHLMILGLLEDKDAATILRTLAPWGDTWILTRSSSPRAANPEKLLHLAQSLGINKQFHLTRRVGEACRQSLAILGGKLGTVVVGGSLTTAGEARRIFKKLQQSEINVILSPSVSEDEGSKHCQV